MALKASCAFAIFSGAELSTPKPHSASHLAGGQEAKPEITPTMRPAVLFCVRPYTDLGFGYCESFAFILPP